jgi:hypothetical protein
MARRLTLRRGVDVKSSFLIDGTEVTASAAEINAAADIATAGTVEASKGLVVDANKDLASLRNFTATGTATLGAIAANDSALDIAGLAAASAGAGGAVSLVGGRGHTNGAGGALTITGGAGSAAGTGTGGAFAGVGGASGGGATGNGGGASIVGGDAASTNGNGGAAAVTGGDATGTGTGGAISITSGASAGAGGTAGAVNIDTGAAAGGTAGNVIIAATNAAGVDIGTVTKAVTISGAKPVLGFVDRLTTAEVNAGHTVLAPAAGRTVTVLYAAIRAIGGTAADVTSVDIKETTTGNVVLRIPVAVLAENAVTGVWSANAVSTYLGVALSAGNGLEVEKDGTDVATATHFDVFVQYTLS